ncbi:MAG TPA: NAD(P)-dependent oxidoreductase [Vicinamibacterales bacterium]|jgi:D-3-phosphoglycerate dehydrogenase|nr:NAD(P)-dependent oxidoreductase [Vicinamibacterales bacterium]
MRVLVADKFEKSGLDGLKAAGCDVAYEPDLKDDALTDAIRASGADVLVVRSTRVTTAMLDAGRLSLIVRAGAGYNTIDVAGASTRGIYVSNCPGKNAIAVAELAFALILALDRRIPDNVADLRAGKWNKKEYSKARGLFGSTLGLLGIGSIGQEMVRRAAGFGMNVLLWSRRFDGEDRPVTVLEARELGFEPALRQIQITLAPTPGDVAARSDILSLHLALAPDTKNLVNAAVLGRLKAGSIVINTARGEVLDHQALATAIRERGLRVGLDVFANEPTSPTGDFADKVVELAGVYGTHHIGASTDQAQEAIAAETVRIVRCFNETGKVPNVVNLAKRTPATHMLVVRHRDRPGVLAHVFDNLREANLNVQETENIVFEGAEAAVARINLDGAPTSAVCDRIKVGNPNVLDLQVVQL